MDSIKLIRRVHSGVVQIAVERERKLIGNGSGFLVEGGLVTNSHCIRSRDVDTIAIRFGDDDPEKPWIRKLLARCDIAAESGEDGHDYAYIRISQPEFNGRHVFEFTDSSTLSVGEQVVFLGYPFATPYLTSHLGYVSSIHTRENGVEVIQIDGSVNGANSGGPLLDMKTGKVAGIVTRAITGFVAEQFDRLMEALHHNQVTLQAKSSGRVSIEGIDVVTAIGVSFAAMEEIARDLRRSANVGIGFAYSANHVQEAIRRISSDVTPN